MYDEGATNAAVRMYFRTLKRYNKKLYEDLGKGLFEPEIKSLEERLDFKLPYEVYSLYNLKNGLKRKSGLTGDQRLMLDNGLFLSLEQGVKEYTDGLKNIPELKKKLPLFDSGGGDFLVIDCDPESELYRKILIWSPPLEIVDPETIYSSLVDLFLATVRSLTTGVYRYNDNGELEYDLEELKHVVITTNSKVDYWNNI